MLRLDGMKTAAPQDQDSQDASQDSIHMVGIIYDRNNERISKQAIHYMVDHAVWTGQCQPPSLVIHLPKTPLRTPNNPRA